MHRTFHIKTMGCQMNEYDSDFLARLLINAGYLPVDEPTKADVILINTCVVRAKPEQKAVSYLGRMSTIKKKRPDLTLGIVGCMAQKEGAGFIKRFPLVDLVIGPRELDRLPEVLRKIYSDREKIIATDLHATPPDTIHSRGYFNGRVTGYISIMEGCNNYCSYCIVPFVRGREVSRSPDQIVSEAEDLIADGIKDITLLGQNVISYQWEDRQFASLLREVARLDGLLRLRFTTSHPKDLSDEIIQCFGNIGNLCPHLHLPFQAGSNAILRRMKRGYTREQYMDLVLKLRDVEPDIAITSDVMVGFPGESERDFEMTLDLIKRVKFDGLFSFKYSDRNGTVAGKMDNKVDESEKARRLESLQMLQRQITLEKNLSLKGRQVEVLIEGKGRRQGQVTGRTGTNKIVNINSDTSRFGNLVNVTIEECFVNSLRA